VQDLRSTLHNGRFCQVQSHVTQKLGQNQKSGPIKFSLRISGQLLGPIVNGGRKWKDFQLSRARDLDLGSGHSAYRRASLIDLYLNAKCY